MTASLLFTLVIFGATLMWFWIYHDQCKESYASAPPFWFTTIIVFTFYISVYGATFEETRKHEQSQTIQKLIQEGVIVKKFEDNTGEVTYELGDTPFEPEFILEKKK